MNIMHLLFGSGIPKFETEAEQKAYSFGYNLGAADIESLCKNELSEKITLVEGCFNELIKETGYTKTKNELKELKNEICFILEAKDEELWEAGYFTYSQD